MQSEQSKGSLLRKSDSKPAAFKRTTVISIATIIVASAGLYAGTLFNGFVFDDTIQILQNPWIRDVKYVPAIFSSGVSAFSTGIHGNYYAEVNYYYRPLMHLVYMLAYHIFGGAPWGFHLVNLILHCSVCVMVYLLARDIFGASSMSTLHSPPFSSECVATPTDPSPVIAALLFAAHPIHTEAVAWAACLPELLFTLLCSISFYFYIRTNPQGKFLQGYRILSLLSFFFGILSKETALVLPLMFIAYDFLLRKEKTIVSVYLKQYVPYFLGIGLYFVLRVRALNGIVPQKNADVSIYGLIINICSLFRQYLAKLVFPINLSVFHVFHPISSISELPEIASLFVTGLFVAVGLLTLRKNRFVFFSLVMIFVPLLPVFYIPALSANAFTERYLYFPSLGFALLSASLVNQGMLIMRDAAMRVITLTVIVFCLYSMGTISRNGVWKDDYTLFSDAVKKAPDGAIPHLGLGVALLNRGKLDEALNEFKNSLELNPDYELAHYNLGLAFLKKGLAENAIEQFEIALRLNPRHAEAHNDLAMAYYATGEKNKAFEHFYAAVRLQPDNAEAYNNLGTFYGQMGIIDKAIENFEIAVRLSPDHPGFLANLRQAYQEKNMKRLKTESVR